MNVVVTEVTWVFQKTSEKPGSHPSVVSHKTQLTFNNNKKCLLQLVPVVFTANFLTRSLTLPLLTLVARSTTLLRTKCPVLWTAVLSLVLPNFVSFSHLFYCFSQFQGLFFPSSILCSFKAKTNLLFGQCMIYITDNNTLLFGSCFFVRLISFFFLISFFSQRRPYFWIPTHDYPDWCLDWNT